MGKVANAYGSDPTPPTLPAGLSQLKPAGKGDGPAEPAGSPGAAATGPSSVPQKPAAVAAPVPSPPIPPVVRAESPPQRPAPPEAPAPKPAPPPVASVTVPAEDRPQAAVITPPAKPAPPPAVAARQPTAVAAPTGNVARMQLTARMEGLEPGPPLALPLQVSRGEERVYLFTELRGLSGRTVVHRWELNGRIVQERQLPAKSPTWRTYSGLRITNSMTGNWRVAVVDAATGSTLAELRFTAN